MAISWKRKVEEIAEVIDEIGTEWECGFIKDMVERSKQKSDRPPSEKQLEIIERIYDKACNSPF